MSCKTALESPVPEQPEIKKFILVVAAILIDKDNRVLVSQRPEGKWMAGKWEFPGGKIELGETPEYALMRELAEELGIETRPSCFTPVTFASHIYSARDAHVLMPVYACRFWNGMPAAQEGQILKWLKAHDMYDLDFVEADIPLIPVLEDYLS